MGSFSCIFLDRLFEEHATSDKSQRAEGFPNQMDFGAFLDFMLAWDNRGTWSGIQYFFPVLDVAGKGFLTQVKSLPEDYEVSAIGIIRDALSVCSGRLRLQLNS